MKKEEEQQTIKLSRPTSRRGTKEPNATKKNLEKKNLARAMFPNKINTV